MIDIGGHAVVAAAVDVDRQQIDHLRATRIEEQMILQVGDGVGVDILGRLRHQGLQYGSDLVDQLIN